MRTVLPALLLALLACEAGTATLPPVPGDTQPRVDALEPASALGGQAVTLSGRAFEDDAVVEFSGGARARVLSAAADGTRLVVEVPADAESGPVTVRVDGVAATGGAFTMRGAGAPRFRRVTRRADLRPPLEALSAGPEHVFLRGPWFVTTLEVAGLVGYAGDLRTTTLSIADGRTLVAAGGPAGCGTIDPLDGTLDRWEDGAGLIDAPDETACVPGLRRLGPLQAGFPGLRALVFGPGDLGDWSVVEASGATASVRALDVDDELLFGGCLLGDGKLVASGEGALRVWADPRHASTGRTLRPAVLNPDGDPALAARALACRDDLVVVPFAGGVGVVRLDTAGDVVEEFEVLVPWGSSFAPDRTLWAWLDPGGEYAVLVDGARVASIRLRGPGAGLVAVRALEEPKGAVDDVSGVLVGVRGGYVRLEPSTLRTIDEGVLEQAFSGPYDLRGSDLGGTTPAPLVAVVEQRTLAAPQFDLSLQPVGEFALGSEPVVGLASSPDGRVYGLGQLRATGEWRISQLYPEVSECPLELEGWDLQLSPDGRWLTWAETTLDPPAIAFTDSTAPWCPEALVSGAQTIGHEADVLHASTNGYLVIFDEEQGLMRGLPYASLLAEDATPAWSAPLFEEGVTGWRLSAHGDTVVVATATSLVLLDAATGAIRRSFEPRIGFEHAKLAPNGVEVWAADGSALVVLVPAGADDLAVAATVELGAPITGLHFSADGARAFVLTEDSRLSLVE